MVGLAEVTSGNRLKYPMDEEEYDEGLKKALLVVADWPDPLPISSTITPSPSPNLTMTL